MVPGDCNFNLKMCNTCAKKKKKKKERKKENGVFPLVNRLTRVTESSATIIDHVLIP